MERSPDNKPPNHISKLDFTIRKQICIELNREDPFGHDWRGLASKLGYDSNDIMHFKATKDPTDELLTVWGRSADSTVSTLAHPPSKLITVSCESRDQWRDRVVVTTL